MTSKNVLKWFLMTTFVGAAPVLIRLFFSVFLTNGEDFHRIMLSDIIAWGLIANISIFHERDGLFSHNSVISLVSPVISFVFIILFVVLLVLGLFTELKQSYFEQKSLLYAGFVFCSLTFCLSVLVCIFGFLDRENKTNGG